MSKTAPRYQVAAVVAAALVGALYLHTVPLGAATEPLLLGGLLAVLAFAPHLAAEARRRERTDHDLAGEVAEIQRQLATVTADASRASRLAHREGVVEGALRARLAREDGEPPRPRRLHSVHREGVAS